MVIGNGYTPINVVELNSLAVLQMRQQEFDRAISTLQTAVVVLEEIYRTNMIGCHQPTKKRRRISSDSSVSSDSEDEDAVGVVHSVQIMDNKAQAELMANSAVPSEDILLFYDRAFTFQKCHSLDFDLSENKSSLSAMILFNLGLVQHILAIKSGRSSHMFQALRFYRLAHMSLEQVKDVVSMEVHILLLMGLINNMGHIHACLFHREQTQSCIDWLRRAVVSKQGAVLDVIDHDFFYTNLQVIPSDLYKFAPAA